MLFLFFNNASLSKYISFSVPSLYPRVGGKSVALVNSLVFFVARHRLKMAWTLPSFKSSGVKDFSISSFAAFALFRLNPTTQAP